MADLTFLMSSDPPGSSNQFYTLAKKFFIAAKSTVVDAPAKGQTLEGVFKELTSRKVAQGTINLVSHASAFAAMICPVTLASQAAGAVSMSADDIEDAIAAKVLTPPGSSIITDKTRVVVYGCDVGRSRRFLTLLASLFGGPGALLAPRRMGVFRVEGTDVKYRQAHTWSRVQKTPLIASGNAPTGGWPAYRTTFVNDALNKFGRAAIASGIDGMDQFTKIINAAAKNATTVFGPSFFLQEGIDILFPSTPTDADLKASIRPRTNGDAVTTKAQAADQVDDTTEATSVSSTDAYASNAAKTRFSITVVVLAQVMADDVVIAEGTAYQEVTTSAPLSPSPGPKPPAGGTGSPTGPGTGGGSGSSAFNEQLQPLIDQLLADGAAQTDVDALLASLPQGDATDGLATETPDETPVTDDATDPLAARPELA